MDKDLYGEALPSRDQKTGEPEKEKTKKPIKKAPLIAAAAVILAALGALAWAAGSFGLLGAFRPDPGQNPGISVQDYAGSAESRAFQEHLYGGLALKEAAAKYGLTVPERFESFQYEDMKALLGGDLTDGRSTRRAFRVYEDGSFSADQDFTASDGTVIGYRIIRTVKGSVTELAPDVSALGEEINEWGLNVGGTGICLAQGGSASLIIADLGQSIVTVEVLPASEGGGPVTAGRLEEMAKSFNWSVLARVIRPTFSPDAPEVIYGAGVELLPENILDDQSFWVKLPGWGEIYFVTCRPTPEYNDVRFFLSKDGKASDYELHPVFTGETWMTTAAVSFFDVTGDGFTDIIVLNDYVGGCGLTHRDLRIFSYRGEGKFDMDWGLVNSALQAIDNDKLDIEAVEKYLVG